VQLKLLEVFDTKNAIYLVQELAVNGSLAENIPDTGMSEMRSKLIMKGILNGVKFLHKHNIVHRLDAKVKHSK
jgi:serine/threonine protein kinase